MVDQIIRNKHQPPSHEYLVKWKSLPKSEASWELKETLWEFEDKIKAFRND